MAPTDSTDSDRYASFLALHRPGDPLVMPNPWDVGSAKLFAASGFRALATTSTGFAASLGHLDGDASRDEVLTHCRALVDATSLPISADLERCFAESPEGVAETIRAAADTGLAGASIEDYTGNPDDPLYPIEQATERVAAAVEAAHAGPHRVVLTARADGFFHGRTDLADVITRLRRFGEAGADVLYAPALSDITDVATVVREVEQPVNVLAWAGLESVEQLAEVGVARISVGGSIAFAAYGAAADAARELHDHGTFGFRSAGHHGRQQLLAALED